MKQIYDKQLSGSIGAGLFEPAYLLAGEDGYLVNRILSKIVDKALYGVSRDFNLDTYHGMDCSPEDVVSAALSMPMMAERRVVVLKGVDKMRKPDRVADYLEAPSPTTVLVMTAEGAERQKAMSLARQFREGVFTYFYPPSESDTARWITSIAGELGCRISREAAEYLKDMVGNNLALAESELKKVVNHIGDNREITLDDVADSVGDFGLPLVFGISDALADKNAAEAFMMLSKLVGQGTHPLQLNAILAGHWRKLLTARDMMDSGASPSEIDKKLRLNKFNRSGVIRQARSMDAGELARGVRLFAAADVSLKSSAVPGRLVMERLFMQLSGAA